MKILLLVSFLLLTACTKPQDAKKALDDLGFTEITTGGYPFFACNKGDFYHTSFTAKNTKGKVVSGTVCSGILFKNSTVQFN